MKRLIVMTVAICVLWAGAAAAQTISVLVSNVNQGTDIGQDIGEPHVAQPFTTGTASTAGFSDHRHHDRDGKSGLRFPAEGLRRPKLPMV